MLLRVGTREGAWILHCGIYRIDRPPDEWERIGRRMPAEIGASR